MENIDENLINNTEFNIKIKENKKNCLIIFDEKEIRKNDFDNELKNYDSKESLQNNFKSFLEKKRKEKQKTKTALDIIKQAKILNPDQFYRDALREKFINQAKSYLGVPYSKKFYKEGDEFYNSPIFLDCCGLVRRCVNDLNEEFKFSLFGWNQQYQYDILPDEIKFEEMKPGDLIFYSATFYEKDLWKPQLHDLVHVEIYLGGETGEQTIAGREPRGVVSIFDTYKFESSNYHSIIYRFKSIETWLKGIHRSFCPDHLWHEEVNMNNKYSLFHIDQTSDLENAMEKLSINSDKISNKESIVNNEKSTENKKIAEEHKDDNVNIST